MIKITNLKAGIEGNLILNGINLEVKAGEVHAIMGPNGSGKSTLACVIAGKEEYEVETGEIDFEGKNLLELNHLISSILSTATIPLFSNNGRSHAPRPPAIHPRT